jgi:hypothetical protein
MAVPQNRTDLANWCLRKLGAPVITINVDPTQIDDRIDEALRFYLDYHMDGTTHQYYKYQFQQTDIDNGYIQLPPEIIYVVDIFPITGINTVNNMFDIRYQIMLNDLYTLTNKSLVPYYQAMQAIQLYEILLVGKKPIRYNRNDNKLYIDMSYRDYVSVGDFVIVDCYQPIDLTTSTTIWSDRWLQRYTTALIKEQWADNLSKYQGVQLVGGIQMNAAKLKEDAMSDKMQLEQEMFTNYQAPLDMIIG